MLPIPNTTAARLHKPTHARLAATLDEHEDFRGVAFTSDHPGSSSCSNSSDAGG